MRVDYGPKHTTMVISIVMFDHYKCCYVNLKHNTVGSVKLADVEHRSLLTLLLAVGDWSNSHLGCCTHRNNPRYQ